MKFREVLLAIGNLILAVILITDLAEFNLESMMAALLGLAILNIKHLINRLNKVIKATEWVRGNPIRRVFRVLHSWQIPGIMQNGKLHHPRILPAWFNLNQNLTGDKTMSNIKFLLIVSTILSLNLLFIGCRNAGPESPADTTIPVKVVAVKNENISIPVLSSGRLFPKTMVKLSFKIGGIIRSISASEGQSVRKGEGLAQLDLTEINARFSQAQNGLAKAQRDLQRVENLYKDRAATLEQLQNSRTAFKIAQSNLNIVKFNHRHSRITAPAPGKILKRLAEAGELIGPGQPVFLFGSTKNRWVIKTGVSERDIVRLKLNDPARLEFDAYPGKIFQATVSQISESLDPQSGTFEVEATLQQQPQKLISGFVGKVQIFPTNPIRYFTIPVDALVEGEGNQAVVYIVEKNIAKKTTLDILHIFPDKVVVGSGLTGTEMVVTSGAAYLNDGSEVKVMP